MDRPHAVMLAVALAGCAGEAEPVDTGPRHPGAQLAVEVVSATAAGDDRFGDPEAAVNGVRGGGLRQGGFDVYRVGAGPDDALVLGFDEPVLDGDGVDIVVFENVFAVDGGGWFLDPTAVEVSADCATFVAFPRAYTGGPVYEAEPSAWQGFAGLTPVLLHEEEHPVDPLGAEAGGDGFDLADLDDAGIAAEGVRCVRLTAAATHVDPATGAPFPADPLSDGPDIDGVYGRR